MTVHKGVAGAGQPSCWRGGGATYAKAERVRLRSGRGLALADRSICYNLFRYLSRTSPRNSIALYITCAYGNTNLSRSNGIHHALPHLSRLLSNKDRWEKQL